MSDDLVDGREDVVAALRVALVGPASADEVVRDPPDRIYAMAVLYPRALDAGEYEAEEHPDEEGLTDEVGELVGDPVRSSNRWLPASMGLSLLLVGTTDLEVVLSAATYEAEGNPRRWQRARFPDESHRLAPPPAGIQTAAISAFDGRGELSSIWRKVERGHLVTVHLVNSTAPSGPDRGKHRPDDCLYQVSVRCRPAAGSIGRYPGQASLIGDPEEDELALRYSKKGVFAVGHGTSVDWGHPVGATVPEVWTEALPRHELPALTQHVDADLRCLRLASLSQLDREPTAVLASLEELIFEYASWRHNLPIPGEAAAQPAFERLMSRIDEAIARMRSGVSTLASSEEARLAFSLANLVMLLQMHHGRAGEPLGSHQEYLELDYEWYPFQLAFLLMLLPSLVDTDDPDRKTVDLIWFPTGGGKTEAYLGVAAFVMLWRRLMGKDRGTAVITRYTLRLLTTQQFERAAAMVCAAESLRRSRGDLGSVPFSIGLWVGNEATPASIEGARAAAIAALDDPELRNPFPLGACPWCRTPLLGDGVDGEVSFGLDGGGFGFRCPSERCRFHSGLPVLVVDEQLYANPPTFLLGTVDKFARLVWLAEPGVFFGGDGVAPPDLIIQDELHLLNGPLGTTMGLYEHAIEGVIRLRGGSPKVVASTATIRRAGDQVRAVFGRPVAVFPPSGPDESDSFFARADTERPGRLYVGVMSQSHTMATTIVHAAAALLQAGVDERLPRELRDSYWTLVTYHNSLRELGRTITLARDDIPARMLATAPDHDRLRTVDDGDVVELTSNVPGTELSALLRRLEKGPSDPGSISFLASTSMLSVGVDVPRLALMLMAGQPKTVAEYIQASSRVGRSKVPGLVVTLHSATKPRDRSHYESFLGFHDAMYRHVEPMSVTPFALPSRLRALHAALVLLVRHGGGLAKNSDAHAFDASDPAVSAALGELLGSARSAVPGEYAATEAHVERLVAQWGEWRDQAAAAGKRLFYMGGGRETAKLLRDFGDSGTGWETLHSMRNVDRNSPIRVIGEDRSGGRS